MNREGDVYRDLKELLNIAQNRAKKASVLHIAEVEVWMMWDRSCRKHTFGGTIDDGKLHDPQYRSGVRMRFHLALPCRFYNQGSEVEGK